jgi:hypothetical protein
MNLRMRVRRHRPSAVDSPDFRYPGKDADHYISPEERLRVAMTGQ